MAHSADATSVVLEGFISAINSCLRRRARKRKLHGRMQTGRLTVVQRFDSSLNLFPIGHSMVCGCHSVREKWRFLFLSTGRATFIARLR